MNYHNFLVQELEKGETVTPCIDVYKSKVQSDGSIDKIKLIIVVREDLHNKELVGDTWSPTDSMRTFKYFLVYAAKHKARVHQLKFIGTFLREKVKIGYLWSWTVDMQIFIQNIQINLEEPWYYWSTCMVWITLGTYLLMSQQNGYLRQILFNLNSRCICIISMYQMKNKLVSYIRLMTVSVIILLKLMGNGVWII